MSSGVEFDEDKWLSNRQATQRQTSTGGGPVYSGGGYASGGGSDVKGLSGWLIRHRLAKDYKSAQIILLVIMVIDFIITGVVIYSIM